MVIEIELDKRRIKSWLGVYYIPVVLWSDEDELSVGIISCSIYQHSNTNLPIYSILFFRYQTNGRNKNILGGIHKLIDFQIER